MPTVLVSSADRLMRSAESSRFVRRIGLGFKILRPLVSRIVVTGIGLPATTRGVLDLRFPLRWPRMGAVGALR